MQNETPHNETSSSGFRLLLAGADGTVGRHVAAMFPDAEITVLPDSIDSLTPPEGDCDLLVHARESLTPATALAINLDYTRRLLECLDHTRISSFVFLSSALVYGKEEGLLLPETTRLWASGKVGQSKALAEEAVKKWCASHSVTLSILRPATVFGKGMEGWGERMAALVLQGYYFNIRDTEARRSIVLAYDVARVIREIYPLGGIYNVADGFDHTMEHLAVQMGNNRGKAKRPYCLPYKWARKLASIGDRLPPVGRILDSESLAMRLSTLTLSTERLRAALPDFRFHDTAAVIGRTEPDYPYEDL